MMNNLYLIAIGAGISAALVLWGVLGVVSFARRLSALEALVARLQVELRDQRASLPPPSSRPRNLTPGFDWENNFGKTISLR